ncbi:MAG: alpha/beta hydrolase [Micrococcales bacterium]|nr:MAG: alpha/beta hydrolase [Micrococcales bacterium]PIE27351.1 MAG: alpha/beta hydrolase [Micrococcales bacterium]
MVTGATSPLHARANLTELGIGLVAAGAGAALGLVAERFAVGRANRAITEPAPEAYPFGSLHSDPVQVQADDGVLLHAEIDEITGKPKKRNAQEPTVIFCHGYCLSLDSWHFQRLDLRGQVRTVWWDQRGHGRSERGGDASATVTQLGSDLAAVIEACAPTGPLILVGHSMGGMTIMAYAARLPEQVRSRVRGVALISTSSGGLADHDLGIRGVGKLVMRAAPHALGLVACQPGLVQHMRRIGSDLEEVIVQRWSYAKPVSAELLDFTARMIADTHIEVVRDFMPELAQHDASRSLHILRTVPLMIMAGTKDLMVPPQHSQKLATVLPQATLVLVEDANHLVMLEHPERVNRNVRELIEQVRAGAATAERTGTG